MVIPKEELNETLKEETQVDIGGSRQVDSSGNQNQDEPTNQTKSSKRQNKVFAKTPIGPCLTPQILKMTTTTNQKELNPQDDDAIRPQASKDNPPHGLPTPAQSPEPQPNITTASTNREPRFKYIPEKEARPRQEIRGDRDNKLVTFCQGVPARKIAVSNPGEDLSQLISKLQSSIVVWEKEHPSQRAHTTFTDCCYCNQDQGQNYD